MNERRVGIVAYEGCQSLDVAGPLEVFQGANAALRRARSNDAGYAPVVLGPTRAPVRSESGLLLGVDLAMDEVDALDTLIVAGGTGVATVAVDLGFVGSLARLAGVSRRVGSVCTGAFALAAAGLLRDRRATTHWAFCDMLAELVPGVTVDREVVFVHDGVWTSAGVVAGMDLALALVDDDLGPELANQVARWLVVFVRRSAGQPQLSEQLRAQIAARPGVRDLVTWIVDHPASDLSVPTLARRCGMSVRNFARVFRAETGLTPARYVERVRVETARRLLGDLTLGTDEIAARCGFDSADTLRRVLRRTVGLGPREYRR